MTICIVENDFNRVILDGYDAIFAYSSHSSYNITKLPSKKELIIISYIENTEATCLKGHTISASYEPYLAPVWKYSKRFSWLQTNNKQLLSFHPGYLRPAMKNEIIIERPAGLERVLEPMCDLKINVEVAPEISLFHMDPYITFQRTHYVTRELSEKVSIAPLNYYSWEHMNNICEKRGKLLPYFTDWLDLDIFLLSFESRMFQRDAVSHFPSIMFYNIYREVSEQLGMNHLMTSNMIKNIV